MTMVDIKTLSNSNLFIVGIGLLGPVGGLLVFSILHRIRRREISERVRQAGGSIFLNSFIKEYGYWWLHVPSQILIALRIHPTTITLAGLAIVMMGATFVANGWFGIGGLAILLGSLSDMLDGIVARERNLTHKAGEYVDSLVDRYTDLSVFVGLGAYCIAIPAACGVIVTAAIGSVMVSYARAKAESLAVNDVPKGPMQRAERAVLLGFGIYLSPVVSRWVHQPEQMPWLAVGICGLIAVLANISAVQMAVYTTAALRRRG
jgi:phosphatidylglycerophosphate synthase